MAQATSYCETAALFFEFCGCVPAYLVPAVPFVLNAEPGALAEPPGGVPVVWQDCMGWPVVCAGPDPGVAVEVVDGRMAGVPPLGGEARAITGARAMAPAVSRLMVRFISEAPCSCSPLGKQRPGTATRS